MHKKYKAASFSSRILCALNCKPFVNNRPEALTAGGYKHKINSPAGGRYETYEKQGFSSACGGAALIAVFGEYKDAVALMIYGKNASYTQVMRSEEVDGVTFNYWDGNLTGADFCGCRRLSKTGFRRVTISRRQRPDCRTIRSPRKRNNRSASAKTAKKDGMRGAYALSHPFLFIPRDAPYLG